MQDNAQTILLPLLSQTSQQATTLRNFSSCCGHTLHLLRISACIVLNK
jgi:hypothetical protein